MSDWIKENQVLIIGHRGASAGAPENTMAAFRLAVEQGADGFEFDVHLSKDGVPVLIHDEKLERTTNGNGPVSNHTVEELKAFDAGRGETIPTLDELFSEFGKSVLYNIELKGFYFGDKRFQEAVAEVIDAHGVAQQVVTSSFSFLSMHRFRSVAPNKSLLGMIRYPSPQALSHYLFRGEVDHPHFSMVNEQYMTWARSKELRVHVWTVNDVGEAKRLIDLGVHGLITDRPGDLRAELNL